MARIKRDPRFGFAATPDPANTRYRASRGVRQSDTLSALQRAAETEGLYDADAYRYDEGVL